MLLLIGLTLFLRPGRFCLAYNYTLLLALSIVTTVPSLKDRSLSLHHSTIIYAADWKVIRSTQWRTEGYRGWIPYQRQNYGAVTKCWRSGLRWTPLPLGGSCLLSLSHLQCPVIKLLIKVTSLVYNNSWLH